MNIHEDFEEFLKLLNKTNVEYVIVGGYAVGFHGYVRFTKDLDILFRNHPANIANLRTALTQFGFPVESLSDVAFSEQGKVIPASRRDLIVVAPVGTSRDSQLVTMVTPRSSTSPRAIC